jgi:hypothetical protein
LLRLIVGYPDNGCVEKATFRECVIRPVSLEQADRFPWKSNGPRCLCHYAKRLKPRSMGPYNHAVEAHRGAFVSGQT